MRRLSISTLFLTALGIGCSRPDAALYHSESRTAPFPGGVLEVQTQAGAIIVEGWDRPELEVTARIRQGTGAPVTWTLSQTGERTRVEAHVPPGSGGACKFILHAPRNLDGTFRTASGAMDAEGLKGGLTFETGQGAVRLEHLGGHVEASSGEGAVTIKHLRASLKGRFAEGAVVIEDVSDGLDVTVGSGALSASELDGKGQGITLRTGQGQLDVKLGDAAGRIRAAAGGEGRVSLKHRGAKIEGAGDKVVNAIIPGSDQQILLESGNSSVTIR